MRRLIFLRSIRRSIKSSISLTSLRLAVEIIVPSGIPFPSMRTIVLVPLPTFVFPTCSPLFLQRKTSHPPSTLRCQLHPICRAFAVGMRALCPKAQTQSNRDAVASTLMQMESMTASPTNARLCEESTRFLQHNLAPKRVAFHREGLVLQKEKEKKSNSIAHR